MPCCAWPEALEILLSMIDEAVVGSVDVCFVPC